MRRLLLAIASISLVVGLVGYLFQLPEYDFMSNLSEIASLPFPNPIDEIYNLINRVNGITGLDNVDPAWYEYVGQFFAWIGAVLYIPIIILKDLLVNVYYGLRAVMILLGF